MVLRSRAGFLHRMCFVRRSSGSSTELILSTWLHTLVASFPEVLTLVPVVHTRPVVLCPHYLCHLGFQYYDLAGRITEPGFTFCFSPLVSVSLPCLSI